MKFQAKIQTISGEREDEVIKLYEFHPQIIIQITAWHIISLEKIVKIVFEQIEGNTRSSMEYANLIYVCFRND